MSDQLNIIARIKPKPAFYDAARTAICGIVKQTRQESGCITFRVNECPATGAIYLYEEWRDEAAFNLHHCQPYTRAVMAAYAEWLEDVPEIIHLRIAA